MGFVLHACGLMKPTLLVLAAGMGSRYGGLKQIDPVGPAGETIIDYSIFDALRAGFGKLVFVIRRDIEQPFREIVGSRFAGRVPLLANMVEGGQTPIQPADELERRGFRIAIFPGGTVRAVARTLMDYYASLREHRTTMPWKDRMLDFDGINEVVGTPQLLDEGRRYEGR